MNNKIIALMTATLLTFSAATTLAQPVKANPAAEEGAIFLNVQGKIVDGRTFVPIREIGTIVGADVSWNQKEKTVTISKSGLEVIVKANSNFVTVNNVQIPLEIPIKIFDGKSFIQAKAVATLVGGTINWDPQIKLTTFTYNNNMMTVSTDATTTNRSDLTQALISEVIQKANEAVDLSAYKQIRTHFKPYFADTYINTLIANKGVSVNHKFTATPYSNSSENKATITQIESPSFAGGMNVERTIELQKIHDSWFVTNIIFTSITP